MDIPDEKNEFQEEGGFQVADGFDPRKFFHALGMDRIVPESSARVSFADRLAAFQIANDAKLLADEERRRMDPLGVETIRLRSRGALSKRSSCRGRVPKQER